MKKFKLLILSALIFNFVFQQTHAEDFSVLDVAGGGLNDGAATTVLQTDADIDMDETGTLTITSANGAETATDLGDITRSAGNPTIIIQNLTTDTDNQSINIDSITFSVTGEGDVTVKSQNNAASDGDLEVILGRLSTTGTLTVSGLDVGGDASSTELIINGDTSVTEASTVSSQSKNTSTLTLNGESITFTNGLILDDNTLAATLKFNGSDGINQTFTGAITVADDGDGKIDVTNTTGTVTLESSVGALGANRVGEVDINTSTSVTASSTIATDLLTINGSLTLSENNNDAVDFDMGASSKLIIGKTVVNNEILLTDIAADATIADGAKLYAPINLKDGQAIRLLAGSDGTADDDTVVSNLNSAAVDTIIIDYAVEADAGNNESDLTATKKSATTTSSEAGITINQANAIYQAYLSAINDTNLDNNAENAFEAALLNSAGTYSDIEDTALAKQVAPQDDMISGSTFATKAMTGSLQGIMSNRMASLRSGDAYYGSGMSAGANMSANSGFIQVFGTDAEQKNKTVGSGTQFGYDAASSGVALGFDGITDNGSVVGLSLSMSETDVDGKGTGKSKNDIDSYTASIYMDKSTDAGYVEGSLTVGLNENNSSRIVNTAGLDRTYKGDYDSEQVSLKIGGGKPNAVGMSGYVTPFGSITATRISTDAYTETSTTAGDNLRLRVAQDDVDSVVGTVGLKYHKVLDNGGSPMISLAINNEFGDSTINSTNTYQGGGSSFKTSTDVEELSATLGLGYSFSSDNASIEFAYEADANDDDYLGHYGSIKLVSKF